MRERRPASRDFLADASFDAEREAGAASGPEHTVRVCEDPDTLRRQSYARKAPGQKIPTRPLAGSMLDLYTI